jgi:fatty acid desaturase
MSDQTPSDAPAVPSHIEARKFMLQGQENQFAALRKLDSGKRLTEMGIFLVIGLTGIALNYGGVFLANGWPSILLRLAGTLLTALMLNACILLMHEGMHGILFSNKTVNRWASVALGATFFMSFTCYRVLHQRHHRYLGDKRDPDDYVNYVHNPRLVWLLQYMRLLVGVYIYLVVMPFSALRHGSRTDRIYMAEEYALLAVLYVLAGYFVPLHVFLSFWLIPLALAGYMTAVRGLSQHGVANASDPYLASRSIQASPLVSFIMLHENFHLEHHFFPEIPSYSLPAANRLIDPRLPRLVTGKSYLGFLLRFFKASLRFDDTPIGLEIRQGKTA